MNSPYGTRHQLTRADQIEIHRQWVDTQRAIDAYWTRPSAACRRCADLTPNERYCDDCTHVLTAARNRMRTRRKKNAA